MSDSAFAWSWNAPRPAVGLYTYEPKKIAPLAGAVAHHPAVKKHIDHIFKRAGYNPDDVRDRNALIQALDRYEPCGLPLAAHQNIIRQEMEAAKATAAAWANTPEGVEARLLSEPFFIREVWRKKIEWLRANREARHTNDFLMGTVKKSLLRLDVVRTRQGVSPDLTGELAAYWFGRWQRLADFTKREALSAANEIASRMAEMLGTECEALGRNVSDMNVEELDWLYCHLGREMLALRIVPPAWYAPWERERICTAILRMASPDWWGRKIWRLRCDWRENQLRAVGAVNKKAHAYVSASSLIEWQEQRRKNRDFFKSHELVDEDGNVSSLEEMINKSTSNPAIRRHELMARMAGVELVAQSRGDVGIFLTITCPSKYHSNIASGHHNAKWNHSTVAQAQRYLCRVWNRATAKLKREDLRPYGFRVAEPHHDGTPHWHALLFMPQEQVKATVAILRAYFIAEDRDELGRNTGVRFKSKKMDPRKGSATAYIAKYISKNIDGHALAGELDDESGKPLNETAKYAMAWASLHRIRQFQPIGQPPISVYRELRKLSNQITTRQKIDNTFKRGAPLLVDPAMDAVCAAADVGCFATYIIRQGGVLIPRENYVVRLAYQPADEMNAYCEIPEKVFGVWSPRLGDASRICTRLVKWKIRAKSKATTEAKNGPGLGVDLLPSPTGDAWSSVNNSTEDEKITDFSSEDEVKTENSDDEIFDFDRMTDSQRRKLWKRLRQAPPTRRNVDPPYHPGSDLDVAWQAAAQKLESRRMAEDARRTELAPVITELMLEANIYGLELSEALAASLLVGASLNDGERIHRANSCGVLITHRQLSDSEKVGRLWERLRNNHGIDTEKLRLDPFGEYQKLIEVVKG
ncbi:TPA: replication endonuclease [Citrobacter freundii]|uniref:replication endonuclease n=1 Tax=Citrobacter freundii TaxID=546 RepID=UPI001B816C3F|nr:replication endonuclease [Citrobacter freundii]HBC2000199.1 replication endonuclease [Citrobacter freundii]HBM8407121.1 replication endonuclease [Citrobacter freundii]HBM9445015.1 replication endonuclease [Citrobacter freundii]HCC4672315.1 replication endonuclease [Citrobacter freundii]